MASNQPTYDFVLYGATSFVGQIMCEYLATYEGEDVSWAMAGRSEQKLLEVKQRIGLDVPHIVVSADDESGLLAMCEQTKVVITTVGPYALYGESVVKACVQSGTDYCDLTGEPQWIKRMVDKYHAAAQDSGARLVNCTGFDSIPSDLGVYHLQKLAIERTYQPASQIKMRVRRIRGGASGGTVASLLNVLKEAKNDPALRKALVNPYVLCPDGHPFSVRQKNHKSAEYDDELQMWTMPFVMASINERVVHRSNALLGNRYGENFKYDEAMSAKNKSIAKKTTFGLGAFMVAANISPLRALLEKFVLPKPGEGPSKKEQLNGMYDMRFYGTLINGEKIEVKVEGDRDPGYGSTAKMIVQSGLCIAHDIPDAKGGFWTPASVLNEALIARLAKHAGVTVEEVSAA
ncbi:saccharopine dehydrogenase family protein [Alteromonas gracilis]|uniref:saccharopine dehydrogenase family protein n=1 Tax=Alteromonas gracilis TaxID=1479524 RepID=UPI0030CEFFF3